MTEPGAGHVALTDAEPTPPLAVVDTQLVILIGPTNAGRVRAGLSDLMGRMREAGVPLDVVLSAFHDEIDAAAYSIDPAGYGTWAARDLVDRHLDG